jgi:hypothetical protein
MLKTAFQWFSVDPTCPHKSNDRKFLILADWFGTPILYILRIFITSFDHDPTRLAFHNDDSTLACQLRSLRATSYCHSFPE